MLLVNLGVLATRVGPSLRALASGALCGRQSIAGCTSRRSHHRLCAHRSGSLPRAVRPLIGGSSATNR
eukprot:2936549-Pyramimonas_sp.AAC.1